MDVIKSQSRGARVGCHGIFNSAFINTGFTLVDSLITLGVVSIVFSLGIPSLKHTLTSNRLSVQVNEIAGTLAYSRSEAIKRKQQITLCQTQDNLRCDSSGDWSPGWMLFVDLNANRLRDNGEQLLHSNQALSQQVQVSFNGSGGRDGYVVYKMDGSAYPNGSFIICDGDYPALSRALILKHNGRLRLSDTTAQGKQIKCSPPS